MKKSKIVLSLIVTLSLLVVACENKSPNSVSESSNTENETPKKIVESDNEDSLNIVASPKPESDIEESSPQELEDKTLEEPFIIGKSAPSFGGGSSSEDDDENDDDVTVVPSLVSGQVLVYNQEIKSYSPATSAKVSIGSKIILTDSRGFYTTEEEINEKVDISAELNGYITSTVSDVTPGSERDIHLQPNNKSKRYNQNTISFEYESLGTESPEPDNKKYPNKISFGDLNESRFIKTLLDTNTGNYLIEINPVAERTTAEGHLLEYDIERDGSGNITNPTQMKSYKLYKNIAFRVGDTIFPEGITPTEVTSSTQADLLSNFTNINADFRSDKSYNSFICNAYIVFNTGEKILASTYTGSKPTKVSFRLPKIDDVTYTIEAHAGSSLKGSDVVISGLKSSETFIAYLLDVPENISPFHKKDISVTPNFSWSKVDEARSYQVEIKNINKNMINWESNTKNEQISYPIFLNSLENSTQYQYKVVAMDFSKGGLNILSNESSNFKVSRNNSSKDLPFELMLINHDVNNLPKGYRVSYNTALFTTK